MKIIYTIFDILFITTFLGCCSSWYLFAKKFSLGRFEFTGIGFIVTLLIVVITIVLEEGMFQFIPYNYLLPNYLVFNVFMMIAKMLIMCLGNLVFLKWFRKRLRRRNALSEIDYLGKH